MEKFMDKIRKEFDKGITIVSAKSKEIVDTARVKSQIEDLKEEKQLKFEEIGQIVYKMFQEKDFDGETAIQEKCQMIAGYDQQIDQKELELRKIYVETQEAIGKVVCESCGAVSEEEVKFCSNCGARILKVE